ncbi:PREDICTED: protein TSSC4 isoform X2 [Crocodylus porosus]|uniref:protein TSSC4 isoform X2 n=1 Tax=Crocodylus porosus TaxID=8502 RepID=UPI00093C48BC|nr:PREDICTED: protein TSSC4 isoform X2 [Crocodylus porosus]
MGAVFRGARCFPRLARASAGGVDSLSQPALRGRWLPRALEAQGPPRKERGRGAERLGSRSAEVASDPAEPGLAETRMEESDGDLSIQRGAVLAEWYHIRITTTNLL